MSYGSHNFSEAMNQAFGVDTQDANSLYQKIVDEIASLGLSPPAPGTNPTMEMLKDWAENSVSYLKKIEFGTWVKGTLKVVIGGTLAVLALEAVLALSAEAVAAIGTIILYAVVAAAIFSAAKLAMDVLQAEWKQFQQSMSPSK